MSLRIIILLFFTIFTAQSACFGEVQTLAKESYSSKSMQIQQFAGRINLDQVDNKMPLTLNFTNGRFAWVQVFLTDSTNMSPQLNAQPRGMLIVDPRSFKNGNEIAVDVTGKLRRGTTVLLIRGAGVPGSTIGWSLTTVTGTKITSVEPKVIQAGGTVTLGGSNFSPAIAQNTVMFNNTKAKVVDATADSIKAEIPDTLPAGSYQVTVTSAGTKSNPVNVKVRGVPEVTSTNMGGVRLQTQFQIFGKNFSDVASENTVTMGSESAKVESATTESLTVTAPMFPDAGGALYFNPPRGFEITVKVGGVAAKGHPTVYVGPYPWGN